jgi:hypothetical protein
MTRCLPAAVAAVVLALPAARGSDDDLATSLDKRAADAVKVLKDRQMYRYGVLKFLVRRGDGPFRDDAGELNTTLTNKVYTALLTKLDDASPFVPLEDVNGVIAEKQIADADHRTPAGRKAFFTVRYPAAFGDRKVAADGFVVGTCSFAADLTSATLELSVFDRTGKLDKLVESWTVSPDPQMLGEARFSYTLPPPLRKAVVSGQPVSARDVQASVTIPAEKTAARSFAPLADCPVNWQVRYNGKPVTPVGNTLPEPGEDDRVSFVLTNRTADTYAVVLMVNGENTLYQERQDVFRCRKWVLEPNTETVVSGFQTEEQSAVPFQVLKPEAGAADAVRYGENAGTFRLVVYAGKVTDSPPKDDQPADDRALVMAARGTAKPVGIKPQSLRGLKSSLRESAGGTPGSRGLVVKGSGTENSETVRTFFAPASSQPVADISLRYYTPGK